MRDLTLANFLSKMITLWFDKSNKDLTWTWICTVDSVWGQEFHAISPSPVNMSELKKKKQQSQRLSQSTD